MKAKAATRRKENIYIGDFKYKIEIIKHQSNIMKYER